MDNLHGAKLQSMSENYAKLLVIGKWISIPDLGLKNFLAKNPKANSNECEKKGTSGWWIWYCVQKPYEFAAARGKNVLNIKDTASGKWLLRVDKAHQTGATWDHINLNPQLTKMPDPHTHISAMTMQTAKITHNTAIYFQKVWPYLMSACLAYDAYSIAKVAANEGAEKAVKETAQTGFGYAGAYSGSYAGAWAGTQTGGLIGSIFGPAGTIAFGAVGGLVGSIAGAFEGDSLGRSIGAGIIGRFSGCKNCHFDE